jgi:catechol 2,3-dioxygenase-like lactoylglutathione lyase family enzyme
MIKMPLSHSKIVGFIPSTNLETSKTFYQSKLGLTLVTADDFALGFEVDQTKLRITKVPEITPADYTVFGWEVSDIKSSVKELTAKGLQFEHYDGLPQNEQHICTFPGGSKVAWLKDPDGNTLSITQFEG